MRRHFFILAVLCAAMVWGGYRASGGYYAEYSKAETPEPDVLAAAGRPGMFASADGGAQSEGYRISALSAFSNVALHVKDNYVDPERINEREMLLGALNEIEREIAEVLVEDLGDGRIRVSVPGHDKVITTNDVQSLWEINLKLREVFRFFEKHLPPQKDMRAVEYAAINGALSTLDPHSILLKPEAFAEMKTSTKGEFGGLGIVISIRDGKLTIISPLDGTPASKAGLKAMDIISRIGDVSTVSMPIEEAVQLLRGPEGSKVTVWVERTGWPEARKYILTRQRIKIESVESQLLANKVGYVKIKNFQQNTGHDLDEHVEKLEQQAKGKLTALIVDLRNNPGGLLEQAIKVSDKFLSSGDIVTTVGYGNKLREPKRATWSTSDLDIPLAVLVNNGSASASEIVAGALKNQDRAVIIGSRTFGKGSVQVLYDFADNSALKLTIAQYLTPGDVSIQSVGVQPDIALNPAWITDKAVRVYYRETDHGEQMLTKHLDRAKSANKPTDQEPSAEFSYVVEKKETNEDNADEEAAAPDKFEEDYLIRFSRELLTASGRSKRSETLKASKAYLTQASAAQGVKLKQELEKLGTDWSEAAAKATEAPMVSAKLFFETGVTDGMIAAGNEVALVAEVSNHGHETLYQVHGTLETDHPAFKGREYFFGAIPAGGSKTWKVTTKIPKEAASRSDVITLNLASGTKAIETKAALACKTKYMPHPQFSYSYVLDDEERGDGDGVLEYGEGVNFIVYVTNVGPGAADNVSLRLKSAAGDHLFLEEGRAEIGAIPSKATKVGKLKFRLKKPGAPAEPANDEEGPGPARPVDPTKLPIELTIYDPATGEWLDDEITLRPRDLKADHLTKGAGTGVVPKATVVRASAAPDGQVIATLDANAHVRWNAKIGNVLRISLGENATGWIDGTDIKKAKVGKNDAANESLVYVPERRPPSIELEGELGGRVVSTDSVVLSGQVKGRRLRDMYVVVNDKKILYLPGPVAKPGETAEPVQTPDDAVSMPFSHKLDLVDGLNKVLIVARLDERVVSYRSLFVSRVKPATPVAEVDRKGNVKVAPKPN